jgi:putative peptidoglycan lipid II flippase
VLWNVAIIVGIAIGVPAAHSGDDKLYVYAIAVLLATFVQVLLPIPWLRTLDRGEERLRVLIDWRDPAVWAVFRGMLPVTLSLGLINVNALIDTWFASHYYPDIGPTSIQKAFLVYMLPQGMFSVALATVLFPTLSRFASRGDIASFRAAVSDGMRQIVFLLAPAAAFSAVLATPIVRLLYQRGAWTPHATAVTAGALAAFSGGLVFNGLMLLLNRAFFSLRENWIPTAVAVLNLILNGVLDAILYRFGVWGIPLSTAFVNVAGVVALYALLRSRIGSLYGAAVVSSALRIAAAAGALAVVAVVAWRAVDGIAGRSFFAQTVSVVLALAAAVAVYLAVCRLLRVRELEAIVRIRRAR